MRYDVDAGGRIRKVNVHRSNGTFVVEIDGVRRDVDVRRVDAHTVSLLIAAPDGSLRSESIDATLVPERMPGSLAVHVRGHVTSVNVNGRLRAGRGATNGEATHSGPMKIVAPMPGKVVRILAKPGQLVTERQAVIVIEAMKMENELRAGRSGVVSEVHATEGPSVDAGTVLAVI